MINTSIRHEKHLEKETEATKRTITPTTYRRELEKRLKLLLEAKISLEPDIKAGPYRRIIE